jgi:hypothetical protein
MYNLTFLFFWIRLRPWDVPISCADNLFDEMNTFNVVMLFTKFNLTLLFKCKLSSAFVKSLAVKLGVKLGVKLTRIVKIDQGQLE